MGPFARPSHLARSDWGAEANFGKGPAWGRDLPERSLVLCEENKLGILLWNLFEFDGFDRVLRSSGFHRLLNSGGLDLVSGAGWAVPVWFEGRCGRRWSSGFGQLRW